MVSQKRSRVSLLFSKKDRQYTVACTFVEKTCIMATKTWCIANTVVQLKKLRVLVEKTQSKVYVLIEKTYNVPNVFVIKFQGITTDFVEKDLELS